MPNFYYTKLPDPGTYIRLLRVFPQSNLYGLSTFHCELIAVLASAGITYRALSHRWDSPDAPRRTIHLNQCDFDIKENLYSFLHYYTGKQHVLSENGEYLWVDAICIDQASNYEKSYQVTMMGQIYRNAQSVIVWLGVPQDDDISNAFEFYHTLSKKIGHYNIEKVDWNLFSRWQAPLIRSYWALLQDDVDPSSNNEVVRAYWTIYHNSVSRHMQALEKIFQYSYWRRAWVVQEVILGKRIDIWSGEFEIPWDLFDFLTNTANFGLPRKLYRGHAENLMDQRRNPEYRPRSLQDLVLKNKGTKCRDPRDKIFAFMSLVDNGDRTAAPTIKVDYDRNVMDLFRSLFRGNGAGFAFMKELYEELETGTDDPNSEMMPFEMWQNKWPWTLLANYGGMITAVWNVSKDEPWRKVRQGHCYFTTDLHKRVTARMPQTYGRPSSHHTEVSAWTRKAKMRYMASSNLRFDGLCSSNVRRGDHVFHFEGTNFGVIGRCTHVAAGNYFNYKPVSMAGIAYPEALRFPSPSETDVHINGSWFAVDSSLYTTSSLSGALEFEFTAPLSLYMLHEAQYGAWKSAVLSQKREFLQEIHHAASERYRRLKLEDEISESERKTKRAKFEEI